MSVKYICDSCGNDCMDEAFLITIQEMAHPMRFPLQGNAVFTKTPGGIMPKDGGKQFMVCQNCLAKTGLPNPFNKKYAVKGIEGYREWTKS